MNRARAGIVFRMVALGVNEHLYLERSHNLTVAELAVQFGKHRGVTKAEADEIVFEMRIEEWLESLE